MARYQNLYDEAAKKYGLSPDTLRTFARIESGHNPNVRTGSYRGLFQLSPAQFRKFGGTGNIFDPRANTFAGAAKIANLKFQFVRKFGREPSVTELYMMHQQGPGGAAAHLRNPDQPAWKSMYSTAEGRQKGPAWAKRAIWGNVPNDVKRKYGSVENMTSKDFVDMWNTKVQRFHGGDTSPRTKALATSLGAPGLETGPEQVDPSMTPPPVQVATYRSAQEVGIPEVNPLAVATGPELIERLPQGPTGSFGVAGPANIPPLPGKAPQGLSFSQKMAEYWSHPAPSGPVPWALADALEK